MSRRIFGIDGLDIHDRTATWARMLLTILSLLLAAQAPQIGQCDPVDGPRTQWSAEQRAETRARVRAACRALGAAPVVCTYLDVVGMRESSWRSGIRHRLGDNENGIGPLGLNKPSHTDKWPGPLEPALCSPEPSTLVALHVVHRAQVRWHARDLVDVQAIYAGRWKCVREYDGSKVCFIVRNAKKDADICRRLAQRGVDCHAPLPKRAAGKYVPVKQRPKVADELERRWRERQ